MLPISEIQSQDKIFISYNRLIIDATSQEGKNRRYDIDEIKFLLSLPKRGGSDNKTKKNLKKKKINRKTIKKTKNLSRKVLKIVYNK